MTTRFLDPVVLARIDDLELLARTVVDGFISGLHQSPYLGLSTDFAEHRPYMPGDDIRRVDWRVYGRTDRFYVKEFEADTNANVSILLDVSRSMAYGSGPITKLDYAKFLAAALAYLSRRQRDRIGLVAFDSGIVERIPPAARHLEQVLHALDRLEPAGKGELARPLRLIAETLNRRSLLILISDLYEQTDSVVSAVNDLRDRGNDVIVLQVLDPVELEFPFDQPAHFEDLETGDRIPVVPERQGERYRELMRTHVETLGRRFGESRVDYMTFPTSKPLDFALFEYLNRRRALTRVR